MKSDNIENLPEEDNTTDCDDNDEYDTDIDGYDNSTSSPIIPPQYRFNEIVNQIISDSTPFWHQARDAKNKTEIAIIKDMYPHFVKTKNFPKNEPKLHHVSVIDILTDPSYAKYTPIPTINQIAKYCIPKIRGIFKHAQSKKTAYCNQLICKYINTEPDTISICISKNSLESHEQWFVRLSADISIQCRGISYKPILLISSSKTTHANNGLYVHCSNITKAWSYLKTPNNKFKVIFVCSNKVRIDDIYTLARDFQNLRGLLYRNLRIFHDEAHNIKEGIPAYRAIVEHIIIQPNVLSYTPISATNLSISDNSKPLWKINNLELYAMDYTSFDKTKSTDPHFSSFKNAQCISFEVGISGWQNILEETEEPIMIPEDTFKKIYPREKEVARKRQFDFCIHLKGEHPALINGLKCLNLNEYLKFELFIPNQFNMHIISGPIRKGISKMLCDAARTKSYNPIVLGIYGSVGDKYHLMYEDGEIEVSHIMGTGEFNEKLYKLFKYLDDCHINRNRPFIIIGNYNPTGESLTFVNSKYGTVRSIMRVISTTPEENYQSASRVNYMTIKFKEENPDWEMPAKYVIGPAQFIHDILMYENINDDRIDTMLNSSNNTQDMLLDKEPDDLENNSTEGKLSTGITAVPMRITISDLSHPDVRRLIDIMNIPRRSFEDKREFLVILKTLHDADECEIIDHTGKFKWDEMRLIDFRSYKNPDGINPTKGYWKFNNYQSHFACKTPFINSKNNINENQCEILTCVDNYILLSEPTPDGKPQEKIEKNLKNTWWMGYKYEGTI
jgi:hypothetical protein